MAFGLVFMGTPRGTNHFRKWTDFYFRSPRMKKPPALLRARCFEASAGEFRPQVMAGRSEGAQRQREGVCAMGLGSLQGGFGAHPKPILNTRETHPTMLQTHLKHTLNPL